MILAIRTDKPEAELYVLSNDGEQITTKRWQAHRQLGATLHYAIEELLSGQSLSLLDITGVLFYQGPGSFTGLRIGASVANSLGDSYDVPIAVGTGEGWLHDAVNALSENPQKNVSPNYGSDPHITTPRK